MLAFLNRPLPGHVVAGTVSGASTGAIVILLSAAGADNRALGYFVGGCFFGMCLAIANVLGGLRVR